MMLQILQEHEMKTLYLQKEGNENPHAEAFMQGMKGAYHIEERVYRIPVIFNGNNHTITSTSKDVILRVAGFSAEVKHDFVGMINYELMQQDADTELFIASEDKERALLVMRIEDGENTIISVQPSYK